MERQYFKLASGYLHIDGQAIVFTRSGNWGEAERTVERTGATSASHTGRVISGLVIVGCGTVFAALKSAHGNGSLAFVLATAGGVFGLYKLFDMLKNDFARSYRIPFSKIRSIERSEGALRISFVNAKFKEDRTEVALGEEFSDRVLDAWRQHPN